MGGDRLRADRCEWELRCPTLGLAPADATSGDEGEDVRARLRRLVVAVAAMAVAISVVLGVTPSASAVRPSPRITAGAVTVDCGSLQNGFYTNARVTSTLSGLTPGASYTLTSETAPAGTEYSNDIPITADAQGAAVVDVALTGTFVASSFYLLKLPLPQGALTDTYFYSSACDSGVSAIGAPTIGYTCDDRYTTATGVSGTAFHVTAALRGFSPGVTYSLYVENIIERPTFTAGSDGSLTFDFTASIPFGVGQPTEAWSLSTTSQGGSVANGTVTLVDTCPPMTVSNKRAGLRHDADLTGDGYGDLLGVDWEGRLWLYTNGIRTNPGHVPFSSGRIIGTGWLNNGPIQQVRQGDLTGDGYTDLAAIRSDGSLVAYYNNIGSSPSRMPYTSGVVIGSGWQPFTGFALADVNGDGYADIVAEKGDGTLYYYQNHYASDPLHRPFSSGVQLAANPFYWTGEFGGGDYNGDGYSDLDSNGLSINPDRVPAGSHTPYTGFYGDIDLNTIGYDLQNASAGWSDGDYEARGSVGEVFASPGGNGQLVYVKDPTASSAATATVIGSGWQMFAFLVH